MGAEGKITKCGEILVYLKKRNKKTRIYKFHCNFCETSWDQMKKFTLHVESEHLKHLEDISEAPTVFEPEIKIEEPSNENNEQSENKILHDEGVKKDPLETEAALLVEGDNEQLSGTQPENEDGRNKNIVVDIKIEEINESCSDDNNDDDYKPSDEDESSSEEEKKNESADKEPQANDQPKKVRKKVQKRQKNYKEYKYLAIDSEQKDLNVALLQAFEKKPLLWDIKEKCRNEEISQKAYEAIATKVNDKLGTNITWEFARTRLDIMRFECSYELEKKLKGESYILPWYHDHMKYLDQNIESLTKCRIKKRRFKNIDETNLSTFIELYKKYQDLWQVNGLYYGITAKRDEIFNKIIDELKQNWNININYERLRDHIQFINRLYTKDRENELKCELADEKFLPISEFYKDLSFLSESQGPFRCLHCNKFIKTYESFQEHIAGHTNTRPFKCPLCESAFKKFKVRLCHIKRHLGENSFCCDICGKSYPRKTELNRHLTYHTGEKPFLCQICGISFRASRHYDNHIRRHENRFRFKCEVCKLGFNLSKTYKDHVKSHLNVRDIICNICGKGFTARRYLNNHKLIHDDKKHYKCHICGKEFAQGASLRNHRKLHKPKLPPEQIEMMTKME